MLVVRPISMSDYDALHTCAVESGHGFTSLPVNEELLTNRIKHSESKFSTNHRTRPKRNKRIRKAYNPSNKLA